MKNRNTKKRNAKLTTLSSENDAAFEMRRVG